MNTQIRRLSYALGAEIMGIDLRYPLDDNTFNEIHRAFLENDGILLFRGQALTQEQHIAFSRRFGELDSNDDSAPRFKHPNHPEILLGFNIKVKGTPFDTYQGEHWHTDRSFLCAPPSVSLLRGIDMPKVGGDTLFANMYLAYERLSDGMKTLVDRLECLHNPKYLVGGAISANRLERGKETPLGVHPLVRVHPETGRKALYMGEFPKVTSFVGMTLAESRPLIDFLCAHATRPQFCYRHQWRTNDLIVWDNRCLMHNALGDYDRTQNRDTERTTVLGTPSGYIYEGAPPQ